MEFFGTRNSSDFVDSSNMWIFPSLKLWEFPGPDM